MTTMPWPFPGDSLLQRARHVARAYRERLHLNNRELCDETDALMTRLGQSWVVPGHEHYQPYDEITGDIAAAMTHRSEATIRRWTTKPHPTIPGQKLLPVYGNQGSRNTYLVEHVRQAAAIADQLGETR